MNLHYSLSLFLSVLGFITFLVLWPIYVHKHSFSLFVESSHSHATKQASKNLCAGANKQGVHAHPSLDHPAVPRARKRRLHEGPDAQPQAPRHLPACFAGHRAACRGLHHPAGPQARQLRLLVCTRLHNTPQRSPRAHGREQTGTSRGAGCSSRCTCWARCCWSRTTSL